MSEIKDLEQAFFILEHGSAEGISEYLKAIKMIKEQCVPVVRCKDCATHEQTQPGMVYCPSIVGGWVYENWFCADGEEK